MTEQEQRVVRTALAEAVAQWATEQREARGDAFATADELGYIKSDPLAFADLLKGDTREDPYDFILRVLSIIRAEPEPSREPDVMTFRALPVGSLFQFYHGTWATPCASMAHGPWIKLSARRYRSEAEDMAIQIGSASTPVILGRDCMGRR